MLHRKSPEMQSSIPGFLFCLNEKQHAQNCPARKKRDLSRRARRKAQGSLLPDREHFQRRTARK
jgi:hypothetical protein